MSTLKEAIAAVQREINGVLSDGAPSPVGTQPEQRPPVTVWVPERVSVTFELSLAASADSAGGLTVDVLSAQRNPGGEPGRPVPPDSQRQGGHRLTIDFLRNRPLANSVASPRDRADTNTNPGVAPGVAATSSADEARDVATREESSRQMLTELLGPPGFYSSARASVLCDVLRARTLEQALAVAAALQRPVGEIADESVRQARHLIRGIVQTGPLKSTDRAEQLLSTLFREWSIPDLLQFIGSHWRTGDNW